MDAMVPVRHAEFRDLVVRLAGGECLGDSDRALLEEYAAPANGAIEQHQLDDLTVQMVAALTGRPDASCAKRAARALLVSLNLGLTKPLGPIVSAHIPLSL